MNYIQNTNKLTISKFIQKFYSTFFIGAFVTGTITSYICIHSEMSAPLLETIIYCLITFIGLIITTHLSLKSGISTTTIDSNNYPNIINKIYMFVLVLFILNMISLIASSRTFIVTDSFSNKISIHPALIVRIVLTAIEYASVALLCKYKLNKEKVK